MVYESVVWMCVVEARPRRKREKVWDDSLMIVGSKEKEEYC